MVLRTPFERNNLKKYQGIPSEQARSVKELKLINPRWDFPKVANHGIEGVCLIEENFLYDSETRSLKDFSFHFSTPQHFGDSFVAVFNGGRVWGENPHGVVQCPLRIAMSPRRNPRPATQTHVRSTFAFRRQWFADT